jgi:hypothetical protein
MTGYSTTPLAKKLGIKEGIQLALVNEPKDYFSLFDSFPNGVTIIKDLKVKKDIIHWFVTESSVLHSDISYLKSQIVDNGAIWVSWPKKTSKLKSDITEDTIRNLALSIGLVDVKVCAVDETWSGLKLVIPVKERAK